MSKANQRVLTGLRSSGSPHLGNYFGALHPAIELQKSYELYLFLADFHALNGPDTPDRIRSQSLELVATFLVCGLDPNKGCFYAQSAIPEICELAWILGCQAPYGLMLRAHSFKDAQAKGVEVNMGVFNYPILMAADILTFDAALVPVGADQKQHLEMARDLCQRFNHRYGDTFRLPEPLISDHVGIVPGTDGEKMSKSKNNYIPVFASDKDWKKAVMNVVTDSKGLADQKDPNTCNIFAIYKVIASEADAKIMAEKYRAGGYGYGHAKQDLLAAITARFAPMRDQYFELMKRPDDLIQVIEAGSRRARQVASAKLEQVKERVGVIGR